MTEYSNLMLSCECCNETKADYPGPGRGVADLGHRRVIKPDEENPRAHLDLVGESDSFKHKTPTGEFNIQYLRLNRTALRKLRSIRRRFYDSNAYIAQGVSELLDVSLDAVEQRHRPLVLKFQRRLERDRQRVAGTIRELIEAAAKSELLDADPDRRRDLAARRAYLRSQAAIGPGLVPPSKKKVKKKQRRKRPRRSR